MSMARDRFLDTAASLADGTPIDWDAAGTGASSEADRRLLRQLRVVAGVADLHRSTSEEEGEAAGPPEAERGWTTTADEPVQTRGRVVPLLRPPAGQPTRAGQSEAERKLAATPPQTWGHLRLLEKVGEGSFGEVYRAYDTQLSRDVALKLLRADARTRTSLAERLLHEGRTLARVHHQNVVTVFGAEEHGGRVGLWMELVEGRTLAESVACDGPYSAREAALIGQDLCRAIAAVHGAGLLHRDIKAQNVMRQQGGRVVLMDFGAGELQHPPGRKGRVRVTGTPLSLAPEVLAGGPATARSDIYSVGVLLFYLVTGRFPVEAETLDELRAKHADQAHTNLHDARPDLPDSFVAVVERALDANPDQRYASAGALQRALARALGFESAPAFESVVGSTPNLPASARPEVLPAPSGSQPRLSLEGVRVPLFDRRRYLVWLAPAIAAVVVMAAIAFVLNERRSDPGGGAGEAVTLVAIRDLEPETDDDRYFADGFTRQLTARLGEVPGIGVVTSKPLLRDPGVAVDEAPQRVFAAGVPAQNILDALRADALLDGSARRDSDGASVTLRLVRAGVVGEPWTRTFVRRRDEIARLEQDVVTAVARLFGHQQTPQRAARLLDEAYFAYLRGRYALSRGSLADVQESLKQFRRATRLQPDYAEAFAGLAEAYIFSESLGEFQEEDARRAARYSVQRALQLNSELPEAHAMLAEIILYDDWDFERARDAYERALALNPSLEYPRARYAMFLAAEGRTAEAVEQMTRAREVNPLPGVLVGYAAMALHYADRNDEAAAMFRAALRDSPEDGRLHVGLCRVLRRVGDASGAIEHCQRALERLRWPKSRAALAQAYAASGQTSEARAILADLVKQEAAAPGGVTPFNLAAVLLSLGEPDQALDYLEEAFDVRDRACLWLRVDPRFDALREHPRFEALVQRLGPPQP
ncbi:MAG: protein kinase [Luteitalea sp.]|nr:protein kinase [Luteitalea sp.]